MPCPTCDHTLARLTFNDGLDYLHCERCGTAVVTILASGERNIYVPKLVARCRQFEADAPSRFGQSWTGSHWQRLGIAESINRPGDRP